MRSETQRCCSLHVPTLTLHLCAETVVPMFTSMSVILYLTERERDTNDLGANQYLQWQTDSWLHLRVINKLDLALGPTSIHHIQYSDRLAGREKQQRLSGCIKLDYIPCNTNINGFHFIVQCSIMRYNSNCMLLYLFVRACLLKTRSPLSYISVPNYLVI